MVHQASQPPLHDEDLDLTPPEERRTRTLQRRLVIGGILLAIFGALMWFEQVPARHAIKRWQARRLAHQALALIEKSDWANAARKAQDSYQLDDGEVETWRAIGQLLSHIGQNADSLQWWKKVEQAQRLTSEDRRAYAGSALSVGEVVAAGRQIDSLLKESQPIVQDFLLAGNLAVRRGNVDDALYYGQRALADARAKPFEILSAAALILSITPNDSPIYVSAWQRIEDVARDDKNIASLEALVLLAQQQPPTPGSFSTQSTTFSLAQQTVAPAPTIMSLDEVARRLEGHPRARDYHRLLAFKARTRIDKIHENELIDEAVQRFHNSDDETLKALNTWLYTSGRYQTMLDALPLSRALRNRDLFLQHLDALDAVSRFQEARDLLVSEQSPLDAVSQHMYLALAKEQLGETVGPENEWQRALEAADDLAKCQNLGAFAERAGALQIADSAYARASSFAPEIRSFYDARARLARARGQTPVARDVLAEVCRRWPDDFHARDEETYLRLLLGLSGADAERAVHEAELLALREPQNWQARATVAFGNLRLGRVAAALKALEGIKTIERLPISALTVYALVLDANGFKDDAKQRAKNLATASLLPEERELMGRLLREQ